jgi:hypothetical protein
VTHEPPIFLLIVQVNSGDHTDFRRAIDLDHPIRKRSMPNPMIMIIVQLYNVRLMEATTWLATKNT